MDSITIEHLYKKLQEQIDNAGDIEKFYIGKAKDVKKRAEQHKTEDNLPITYILALGKEDTIIKAEKYLEAKYLNDSRCLNKKKGGGPEVESPDCLYFSYRKKSVLIDNIDDLYNENFEWETKYCLTE